jgi:Plasmid pRiA4b ORF-3-like protein
MAELLHLHIELVGIKPSIWRLVAVPDWITLKQLHRVIQTAFAWEDCHLYEFDIAGQRYADYDSDWDFDEPAAKADKAHLVHCLSGKKTFTYTYDFGDDWVHKVTIKKSVPLPEANFSPVCLGGARAAPPDDVGGIGGYENMLAILADPNDDEYGQMKEWLNDDYEPDVFDQSRVDRLLLKIRFKRPPAKVLGATL